MKMRQIECKGGSYYVADSTVIEEGAEIGADTKIWHGSRIRAAAKIGSGCVIGSDVQIEGTVGNGCKIQNGVTVYEGVKIEDDVFVGPFAVFTNDRTPRAFDPDWELVRTEVKRGASIGANATIRCGVTLGELSLVGAGSVVTKNTEPLQCVAGNPARHLGWVDLRGQVISAEQDRPDALEEVLADIEKAITTLKRGSQ